MSPPPVRRGAQASAAQSTLYRLVMTPVVFVSFLVSLAWVEFRYSLLRSHTHDNDRNSPSDTSPHLPAWLHRILYRRQQQQSVRVSSTQTVERDGDHYHSMQSKLLRMEASEAFRIRTTVLCVLGLALAGAAWAVGTACWWAARWAAGWWTGAARG